MTEETVTTEPTAEEVKEALATIRAKEPALKVKFIEGQDVKDLESKLVAWQKRMKAKLPRPNPDYKN